MNLSSIYMSSPDWLKFALVVAPCLMIYGIARELTKSWTAIELARLQGQMGIITLMPPTGRASEITMIDERDASGSIVPMDKIDFR